MNHPLKGTCVVGCDLYGLCHCGCGSPTNLARQTDNARSMKVGQPHVFRCGHQFRNAVAPWHRHGVPLGKVAPVVEGLARVYGTLKTVGDLAGIKPDTLYTWRWKAQRDLPAYCDPEQVRRLASLARLARRPTPFSTFELPDPPRPPLPDESEAARREHFRLWRRYHRGRGPRPGVVQAKLGA